MHLLTSGDGPANARVLVVTDGGGPSSAQRTRLKQALDGKNIKVAVVTDHTRTRFIVSSVAFITSKVKSFRRNEMDLAYEYLEIDANQRRFAERQLYDLTQAVGGQTV